MINMKLKKLASIILGMVCVMSFSVITNASEPATEVIEGPDGKQYECIEISPNSRAVSNLEVQVSVGDELEKLPAKTAVYKVLNPTLRSSEESEVYIAKVEQPIVFKRNLREDTDSDTGLDGATIIGTMIYETNDFGHALVYYSGDISYGDGANGTVLLNKYYEAKMGLKNLETYNVPESWSSYGNTYYQEVTAMPISLRGTATAYNGSYRDNISIHLSSY